MTNPFDRVKIEFHILQSFPVTCLNRDDVGAPKSAIVGGVPRARVSSQCWKRQVRLALNKAGVKIALRTKRISEKICEECLNLGASQEQAENCAKIIASILSKDTLIFMSEAEFLALAQYAREKNYKLLSDEKKNKEKDKEKKALTKAISDIIKEKKIEAANAIDIALFGRMVANLPNMNIEAAASFSHAISTHKVASEIEFFTALDDFQSADERHESAHMGTLEFNSATYYRYICLDLGQLSETLGEQGDELKEDLSYAVEAFIKALWIAVPTARQHTQAGYCGWDYAQVLVRTGQPLQCSFEKPVKRGKDGGYLEPSREVLENFLKTRERMNGSLFGKKASYEISEKSGSIDDLISTVKECIK